MYDGLIADLREEAEWAEANEWETPIMLSDHLKQAADAIEELSKQKLISVEERLPEEGGNYLVVINCPRGQWDEICAFDGEKEWVSIDDYAEIATKWVTHWMPLPEPPKEG